MFRTGGRNERSHSTAQHTTRFSLSAIYNRRSMPNQPRVAGGIGGAGGAATNGTTSSNSAAYADEEEEDDGMDIDATDMDMFTRKSIAMFERYNKEQVNTRFTHRSYFLSSLLVLFSPHIPQFHTECSCEQGNGGGFRR